MQPRNFSSLFLKINFEVWTGTKRKTTLQIVQELTKNKDLQNVLFFNWGEYGTPPSKSHFR